ncbi:MAG TPA: DUF362 domain-containing protein [Desulfomonilia bacterium]|nr:DUF362 domain-containing protein [Desulfomonilia bacterium]
MHNSLIEKILEQVEQALRTALSRREFMRSQAKGALLLTAASSGLITPLMLQASPVPDIGVAVGEPAESVRAAIGILGGMKAFVKSGDKVVIKPNMSFSGSVEDATNTHPQIVRELVRMSKEAGASRIRVLDHPLRPSEKCIQGAKDACRIFGDDIVHALDNKEFYREVKISQGASLKETDVMRDVLEADVLIAAPVAKTHGSTGVSLSMKGMMGLIWNRSIMHWLYDLNTSIVDLCTILRPKLVIIDASRVLTTHGPGGPGKVITPRTVIASRDMVAADATTVKMFEWYGRSMEPSQVRHIKLAHARGLGRMDIRNLNTKKVVLS